MKKRNIEERKREKDWEEEILFVDLPPSAWSMAVCHTT